MIHVTVAELVDATDLKSVVRTGVRVRVPPVAYWAQIDERIDSMYFV